MLRGTKEKGPIGSELVPVCMCVCVHVCVCVCVCVCVHVHALRMSHVQLNLLS